MDERNIGIEVLLGRQLQLQVVLMAKFGKHGEQKKLKNLGNYFGVNGYGVNILVNINESFDDPLPFVICNSFCK